MGITGGSEAYVRDVAQAQALHLGTHIDWLDRWLKPSFVYLQQHPGSEVEDIPPHLRKEYFGQNVTDCLKVLHIIGEEDVKTWKQWFYTTSDHYTWFSEGF